MSRQFKVGFLVVGELLDVMSTVSADAIVGYSDREGVTYDSKSNTISNVKTRREKLPSD
jgi:hypothetical protein